MGYVKIAIYAAMFYVYVKTYREWMKKGAEKLFFVSENKTNGYKQQKLFWKSQTQFKSFHINCEWK